MEEKAGHIHVEGFKMGGHVENYTPCSSQKPEVFWGQTAKLIQPCAERQSKAKELHFWEHSWDIDIGPHSLGMGEFYPEHEQLKSHRRFLLFLKSEEK